MSRNAHVWDEISYRYALLHMYTDLLVLEHPDRLFRISL